MILRMLAKLNSDNQLTLPAQAVDALGHPSHFDVAVEGNRLVLTPSRTDADGIRDRLALQGVSEQDVADAVDWARRAE